MQHCAPALNSIYFIDTLSIPLLLQLSSFSALKRLVKILVTVEHVLPPKNAMSPMVLDPRDLSHCKPPLYQLSSPLT